MKKIMIKIAKASDDDIKQVYKLFSVLDQINEGYYPYIGDVDTSEMENDNFDEDNPEHLKRMYELLTEINPTSILRVVGCISALLDKDNNIVDQNSGTLELHPRIVEALELQEEHLKSNDRTTV